MTQCNCGREQLVEFADVWTYYKGKRFKIENVEVLECSEGHIETPISSKNRISDEVRLKYKEEIRTFINE